MNRILSIGFSKIHFFEIKLKKFLPNANPRMKACKSKNNIISNHMTTLE